MTVSIVKANLKNVTKRIADAIKLVDYTPSKDRVFIKPNVAYSASPKSGIITHPRVVEGLIVCLQEYAEEIIIGEGSGVGHNTNEVFENTGYSKLAEKYGVKLVDLNNVERIKKNWQYGELELPKLLETHEYINVPTMKTHTLTTVTLGMKNQKGLLMAKDKKRFHILGLHGPIRALAEIAQPDLTLVDGILCVEGNTVSLRNRPKKMNLIIAGQNMVEVDNVCTNIMGFDVDAIQHIPTIGSIDVKGVPMSEVRTKFAPAATVRKILNTQFRLKGCSGCSICVHRALQMFPRSPISALSFVVQSTFGRLDFIAGTETPVPPDHGKLIFVGNCSAKLAKKYGADYIHGCPPKPEDVLKAIRL